MEAQAVVKCETFIGKVRKERDLQAALENATQYLDRQVNGFVNFNFSKEQALCFENPEDTVPTMLRVRTLLGPPHDLFVPATFEFCPSAVNDRIVGYIIRTFTYSETEVPIGSKTAEQ